MSTTPFIIAAVILLGSYGIYSRLRYRRELKHFRANLRVGDLVRIKLLNGITVPARIAARNSANILTAREIDSKTQRLTSLPFIYKP